MALKASVHIETARQDERTVLKKTFSSPPFKIADVTEERQSRELHLMLMSSSPGVLDGDHYEVDIHLGEGSKLWLHTQSYQRLFQMKFGAKQSTEVRMAEGSSLVYLPHPVVPHKDAIFKSKNKISLANDCTLIWGEVVSCGRKMNDEVFLFQSYHSTTEIFKCGRLVVKENLLLQPAGINLFALGQLEGYTHQATLIFINQFAAVEPLISQLVEQASVEEGLSFGVTALPVNGLMVRLLGYKAEQLFALLQKLSALIHSRCPFIQINRCL